ncbi:MAG: hypothetical protein QW400_04695 [Candidatus Diapherotrites archaeon]
MSSFKGRAALLILSMFFFSFFAFFVSYSYAQSDSARGLTELSLVFISSACTEGQPRESYSGVVTEYEKRIFNYFRLPPQYKQASNIVSDENEFGQATRIVVGMEVALGSADSGYKINFLKNDVPVEKAPSHLTLAYGIAIEPPTGEDQPQPGKEPQPRKNEWINEGGEIDSPPMINVTKDFISKLCDKGQSKYWHSIYFANYYPAPDLIARAWYCPYGAKGAAHLCYTPDKYCTITNRDGYISARGINQCAKPDYKKFETEVQKVTSIPNVYMASNGYEASVIPFGGLRTQAFGGVQLFRAVDASVRCFISCNGRLDENIQSNTGNVYEIPFYKKVVDGKERFYLDLDQAAEKCKNVQNADPYVGCYDIGSAYFAYVDKIFFPDTMESVQADWLIRLYKDANGNETPKLIFQVPLQLASGIPPEISFEYEVVAVTGEEVLISFKPKANDPDGKVESITWDFGNGKQYVAKPNEEVTYSFTPGYYSVSALAYDNDGLKSKKVRTLNLSLETSRPLFSVTLPDMPPMPPS